MNHKMIKVLQISSLAYIWIFVIAVDVWIFSLLFVAKKLDDAINASVAIGLIAIPLFIAIASILTYVFFGLQKYAKPEEKANVL
ncbi:hypothetical protein HQ531_04755 [bacterium]|nr:hypothetical protein [bacterium]